MEFLRILDLKIGRWLAYVDSCLNAEAEAARCAGFWTLVATALGLVCAAVLISVVVRMILERRRGIDQRGAARYKKPA